MHHGDKSEILDCIVPKNVTVRPLTTAAVLDVAVLVQMLRPRNAVTMVTTSRRNSNHTFDLGSNGTKS